MNTKPPFFMILLAGALATVSAFSQEPPAAPPPREAPPPGNFRRENPGQNRLDGQRFGGTRGNRPGGPPGERNPPIAGNDMGRRGMDPVGFWLERIKEKDPAEFDRLTKMMRENPEELRGVIRQRLQAEKQRRLLGEFPELGTFLASLPEEKRKQLLDRMGHEGGMWNHAAPEGHGKGTPPEKPPLAPPQESELGELAEKWRQADAADQEAIKDQIRARLAEVLTDRLRERERRLDRMEQDLIRMRDEIKKYHEQRDEIIQQRLNDLLK